MRAKRKLSVQELTGRELVAWNVRRLRVERDLSAEALANQSGVDRVYVSRIERALANATVDILERLASALEVEIADFFSVPSPRDRAPEPLPGGRRSRSALKGTGRV
jgi:transcriptional regulator with XRE-family HTH domain